MNRDNVGIALFFVIVAFILTMTILMSMFFGINRYISNRKSKIPMYVFCKSSCKKTEVEKLSNKIMEKKGIVKVRIISKEEAFKDMASKFSIDKELFGDNPFPYSLELLFEPKYTNKNSFTKFANNLKKNPYVEDVNFPLKFLQNMEDVKRKVNILGESILTILYIVEFIVFVSIISVLYSHKKEDFDTLKFFGIKRSKILGLFLKNTFSPAIFAFFASIIFIFLIYNLYDKYANIYYINKELFKDSLKTTFVLNIVIGVLFTFFSSLFIFTVKDEKV